VTFAQLGSPRSRERSHCSDANLPADRSGTQVLITFRISEGYVDGVVLSKWFLQTKTGRTLTTTRSSPSIRLLWLEHVPVKSDGWERLKAPLGHQTPDELVLSPKIGDRGSG